jgi:hypothetical protein
VIESLFASSVVSATAKDVVESLIVLFSDSSSGITSSTFGSEEPFGVGLEGIISSRHSNDYKKEYWVYSNEVQSYTPKMFSTLDKNADVIYVRELRVKCSNEQEQKQNMINDAQGWFFPDMKKLQRASQLPLTSCKTLGDIGQRRH